MDIKKLKPMPEYVICNTMAYTPKQEGSNLLSVNPTVFYKVITCGQDAKEKGISDDSFVSLRSGSQYELKINNEGVVVFPWHQVITVLDGDCSADMTTMEEFELSARSNRSSTISPN